MNLFSWSFLKPKKKRKSKYPEPTLTERVTDWAEHRKGMNQLAWKGLKGLFGMPTEKKEEVPDMSKTSIYPRVPYMFQLQGVIKMEKNGGRSLLADEQGLGKSLQSLLLAYRNPKDYFPIVVICPASAKYVWEDECRMMGFTAEVLEGSKADRHKIKADVAIINYDILGGWMERLIELKPKYLIADEVHFVSGLTSKRSALTRELGAKCPRISALSGTPLTDKPIQLFPIINMLWPDKFPSVMTYAAKYCQPKLQFGKWNFNGAVNLHVLNERLVEAGMIRRLKKDVLEDLPPITRTVVPVKLPAKAMKEYEQARDNFRMWLRGKDITKTHSAHRAEGLIKVGYLMRLAAELKMPQVYDWVDDFLTEGNKLIAFGIQVKLVEGMAAKYGKSATMVNGSVTGTKRKAAIDRFNKDESCKLFVGNLVAAGTNWSCTSASNTLTFELGWKPGEHSQSEQRCHGIGRGEKGKGVNSYYIVAKDTVEVKTAQLLTKKQRTLDTVLDGNPEESDFNLIDEVLKSFERGEC